METKEIQIGRIKNNEENPRTISSKAFETLVKSIQDMPSMSKIRPLVVDKKMITLGGNQRLKAYKEAGFKKVTVTIVSEKDFEFELSQEGATWESIKKEFIVKDNVEFGKWAKELLGEFGYSEEEMEGWGADENDFGEEEIYLPNKNPSASNTEMTQEQMDKKEELLASQMHTETTLKTVVCPHCFEEFKIDE